MPKIFNDDFHITSHKLKEILNVFQKKYDILLYQEKEKNTQELMEAWVKEYVN